MTTLKVIHRKWHVSNWQPYNFSFLSFIVPPITTWKPLHAGLLLPPRTEESGTLVITTTKQWHFSNNLTRLKPQRSSFRSHSHFPHSLTFPFSHCCHIKRATVAAMAAIARLRAVVPSLRTFRFPGTRSFGSAAAVQYNYDDYEEEEELPEQFSPRGMLDAEGSAPERGVQWVMIGEPGAKRHLFAQRLSKLLEVPHISMATLLRHELNPRSSLYQQVPHTNSHSFLDNNQGFKFLSATAIVAEL